MEDRETLDFIRQIVRADLEQGRHEAIRTRFPPEPNGYLHIGHAKAICTNFDIAGENGGSCNLRFDDTNPAKEEAEFIAAIKADLDWLGYVPAAVRHASDYFGVFYLAAEKLIQKGLAFVCDLDAEGQREYRGTLTEPGRDSPFRDRSIDENLALFRQMRAGDFADGARTLRAKIDMASGNINLRDPTLYRIRHLEHPVTGREWCIYPMYDYAHALSDAIEGITHSLCTLEFEDHRPLYDWCVEHVDVAADPALLEPLRAARIELVPGTPRQIEFSRLNLDHTVMSKRKLTQLVGEGLVDGWDDPRMPTLSGMRRRGIPAEAIRTFVRRQGLSKQNSVIDYALLEGAVRDVLDARVPRRFAVVDPVRLVLTNLDRDLVESIEVDNHPKDASLGSRTLQFSPELLIEAEDFQLVPERGFRRLSPGSEVRLRHVGIIRCEEAVVDTDGTVKTIYATLDPATRQGMEGANRKVKGTIHWLSAPHALAAEFRLYDRLFKVPTPDARGADFRDSLNADSKASALGFVEPDAANAEPETIFQFERVGYFVADRHDHSPQRPVFNRTVALRDGWVRPSA